MKETITIVHDATWQPTEVGDTSVRLLVADVSPLLENPTLLSEAITLLSPQRRAKAEACGNPRSRALSVGVTLLLDRLLQEVGYQERDMTYVEGPHGKPTFAIPLSFNLSHSHRMAAAALLLPESLPSKGERGVSLGLDIQHQTRYRPELVRRMFTVQSRERLAACTDETARQKLFAEEWSRAEAYAKATGEGLRWPFPAPPTNAMFHDFSVEDYSGSLCLII